MRLCSLFLVSACLASAQLTDGLTTSVTRTVTLTADQADFFIIAGGGLDTSQQQIAQVFLDAGIANLTYTGTSLSQNADYSTNPPTLDTVVVYQYTFSVPASGLKDAAKIMEALRTKPPALLKAFQYGASLNASQATVEAMRQTVLPQLFAETQKRAQVLAGAAGLKLGAVRGVSESFYPSGYTGISYIGNAYYGTTGTSSTTAGGTQYTFYATVSYGLAP